MGVNNFPNGYEETDENLKSVFQILFDKGLVTEEEYKRLLEDLLKRNC